MNFNMKNRIWKNLSAMSMAFFMTGMVLGGCGQTTVYAAELAYESVEFEEHSETEETICLMLNRKKRIKKTRIKRKHRTLRLA